MKKKERNMNRIRKQKERPIRKEKQLWKRTDWEIFFNRIIRKFPFLLCEEVYFIIFFETLISPRDLGNATKAITAEYQMIFASLFRLLFRKTHMRGTIFHISLFSVHFFLKPQNVYDWNIEPKNPARRINPKQQKK